MNNWLYELKKGDTVILCDGLVRTIEIVSEATRETVTVNNIKFSRRKNESIPFSFWDTTHLIKPTDKLMDEVRQESRKKKLVDILNRYDYNKMPIEVLEKVKELLNEGYRK